MITASEVFLIFTTQLYIYANIMQKFSYLPIHICVYVVIMQQFSYLDKSEVLQ